MTSIIADCPVSWCPYASRRSARSWAAITAAMCPAITHASVRTAKTGRFASVQVSSRRKSHRSPCVEYASELQFGLLDGQVVATHLLCELGERSDDISDHAV